MLRKPGKMRWDYSQPAGKLFVSDGKFLWLYTPAENRVEKMKLKESEDMRAPLAFLLGKLDFDKEFQNIQASRRVPTRGSRPSRKPTTCPTRQVEFVVTPGIDHPRSEGDRLRPVRPRLRLRPGAAESGPR